MPLDPAIKTQSLHHVGFQYYVVVLPSFWAARALRRRVQAEKAVPICYEKDYNSSSNKIIQEQLKITAGHTLNKTLSSSTQSSA